MNMVLFRKFTAALPNVDLDEWQAFLEWSERYIFRNEIDDPMVVEIGSQKGRQKRFWTDLLGMRHISIDISDRLGKPDILGDSHDPATLTKLRALLGGGDVNILYIDGDHSYESARRDYVIYSPLVHNGIVAFHDVKQDRFEVKRFWADLMMDNPDRTFTFKEGQAGIGVLVKRDRKTDPNEVPIVFPPIAEKYIELQANGDKFLYTNFPEIRGCGKYLEGSKPSRAVDLGSGIGRASVYLMKRFGWIDTRFILVDGDSGDKQLGGVRSGRTDFYNSMTATEAFCRGNGMRNFELFNLEKFPIEALEAGAGIDLVYSFIAVGFHWPLEFYLDVLYPKLSNAMLIFTMRGSQAKAWIDAQISKINRAEYDVIDYTAKPMAMRKSILALRSR